MADVMMLDVISTVLVSPWDGVMTTRLSGALLDEVLEVVANDGFEEGRLIVEAVDFGVTLVSLVVGATGVVLRLDVGVDVGVDEETDC